VSSTIPFQRFAARLADFMEASIANGDVLANRGECLPRANEEQFNGLALELFELQFKHNAAYRTICQGRGCTPATVEGWKEIPAVPAASFKELEMSCLAPEERSTVFFSSGTTEQKRSRHWHSSNSLRVYEKSLLAWFRPHFGYPAPAPRSPGSSATSDLSKHPATPPQLLVLTPPKVSAPNSSLVHMFDTIVRKHGAIDSRFVGEVGEDSSWGLDLTAATNCLRQSAEIGNPIMILGTAFSFVHLLDGLAERELEFMLPPASCVLETGGYKGLSRSMPKAELHRLISTRLGIAQNDIVCEYGMAELSSQAYDRALSQSWHIPGRSSLASVSVSAARQFVFPPWARAQLISAESGGTVSEGETGLIRVVDLANIYSVMAVQTEDQGVRGGNGFELLGRAQHVEPRGCSLMVSVS
jgi:hypothetical protein